MPRYEVTFIAPVTASKVIVVDAANEDEAYNAAFEMIEEPFYNDATKWELEFEDAVQVDDVQEIEEIGVETTPVTRS